MKVPVWASHFCLLWPLFRIPLAFILSKVTDVFILSLSPLNLIRIPPFFICMNVSMSAYHPCLLWPLFRIPSEFIPSKFTERCVYLRKCYTFWFWPYLLKYVWLRSIWMCNLISHYLILSPGRCSVQSCCLHPRHRFSDEKRCVAAQISTDFPLYVSRHTLFPHFPCVACRVNSLSLRTISTYLLKLFRCQSFVLWIIVQNVQLPKYTWFDRTNRWNQFI